MSVDDSRQAILDAEHLRLLSIFYWVSGCCTAFFSLFALMYIAMGLVFFFAPFPQPTAPGQPGPPPAAFGLFFVGFGLAFMLILGSFAALKVLAGFWIRRRTHRVLCLIVAGLSCAAVPYGTLLGVFTFMVLLRPSTRVLFHPTDASQEAQS